MQNVPGSFSHGTALISNRHISGSFIIFAIGPDGANFGKLGPYSKSTLLNASYHLLPGIRRASRILLGGNDSFAMKSPFTVYGPLDSKRVPNVPV